ncbi:MAG: type II secretion system protein [Ilumatobacteraceae bacterium]
MNTHMEVLDAPTAPKKDMGFSLVELLIVIVILGILSTVTVFAVRGITDKGQTSACTSETRMLRVATATYFATYNGTQIATAAYLGFGTDPGVVDQTTAVVGPVNPNGTAVTWAAGSSPAQTLVNAGLLKSLPKLLFVGADGVIHVNNTITALPSPQTTPPTLIGYAGASTCGAAGAVVS